MRVYMEREGQGHAAAFSRWRDSVSGKGQEE